MNSEDKKSWLKEGILLQLNNERFVVGAAPFSFHKQPCRGFYFPGFFFQNPAHWIKPRKLFFLQRQDLFSLLEDLPDTTECLVSSSSPSFIEFNRVFSKIKQEIKQKKMQKLVPAFFEKITTPAHASFFLKKIFQNTACHKTEGFLYGFWNHHSGFMGFTPEFLFSKTKMKLQLMALAGSAPNPGPNLMADSKERKEHSFVVKALREALSGLFIEEQDSLSEKTFGRLKHLCTVLEGRLSKDRDFEALCHLLHPTPALGGYPAKKAFHWLKQEPGQQNRKVFASPFGFSDNKDKGFCVSAIRGIQWDSGKVVIGSGCGIVQESLLQKEWHELFLKRETVKKLFLNP